MSDDFEFKPLTEGLGFHKKVIELREETLEKAPPLERAPESPTQRAPIHPRSQPHLCGSKLFPNTNLKISRPLPI